MRVGLKPKKDFLKKAHADYDPYRKQFPKTKSLGHLPRINPLYLNIEFRMKRPKSHYRSGKYSDLIKDQFKNIIHTKKPDIDNLIKFVLDALSGQNGFFLDDNLIESIYAKKIYSDNPKTMILIMDK